MAFNTIFTVNFVVFIFVISCTQRQISASKDDVYTVSSQQGRSDFQDISVIDFTEHVRSKRQAPGTSQGSTTATPARTTPLNWQDLNIWHNEDPYYNSWIVRDGVQNMWIPIDGKKHETLSNSHRTAVTQDLPFQFPFYGHTIDKVTIATGGFMYMSPFIHKFLTATQYIAPLMANFETKSGGTQSRVLYSRVGFLYMSPFLHQWLTATQYIAPLMANFDLGLGNNSDILYATVGEKFVVEWRDVHLQDQNTSESFHFQAILHTNGSVFFLYKKLPIPIMNISSTAHPVKIGLSDAYYIDKVTMGTKRRTIYEYHRVTVNTSFIEEGSVVMVHPRPTCNTFKDCESCVNTKINFVCRWCGVISRCSDEMDWHRQEWISAGCETLSGTANCSMIPTSGPASPQKSNKGQTIGIAIVVSIVVLVLIGTVAGWFYYAYTHPTSASGMWLMEHRPSQMKAKLNNMKFWKRNGTAGDKYAVESTA